MVMSPQVSFTVGTYCEHSNDPSDCIQGGKHLVNMVMSIHVLFTVGTFCEHGNEPSVSIHSGKHLQLKKDFAP
jgi:hypothetical protein